MAGDRLTSAMSGRLIRWLPEASPGRAITAVVAVAGLVVAADTAVVAVYILSDIPWRPLAIIATAASLVRIACGVSILRRVAVMRRTTTRHT